jgi:hypothetical protein
MKKLATALAVFVALAAASIAVAKTATLSGTYKTKITGKGPNTLMGILDGTWKIKLSNGTYTVTNKGKAEVNGDYKIKGSTISLTDDGGPAKCKGTGKYSFVLSGKTLTLMKVSDTKSCLGRQEVLAHPFMKA